MTAVASPPSLQALPRLGWTGNDSQGMASMTAEMFMPRKAPQRVNSSSSVSSTGTTVAINNQPSGLGNGHLDNWTSLKKVPRGFSNPIKAEPAPARSDGHLPPLPTTQNGQAPNNTPTPVVHQPSSLLPSQNVSQVVQQSNNPRPVGAGETPILLTLLPVNGTFEKKQIVVPILPELLRIGRQTNAKTTPTPTNGYFDSKVLSRSHAEIWADRAGKVWIKDVKSSNGTFVNSTRLSLENRESEPHQLREHDLLELGIDIVSEDQKSIVHHKVSAKVEHAGPVSLSVLDVSFGDIDPASGLAAPFPRNMPQYRGRGNSIGSNGSARSIGPNGINGHQLGGFAGPRVLHASLNPITIEQVVRKLNVSFFTIGPIDMVSNVWIKSEIETAKQQNEELDRSHDYISLLLDQEPGQALPPKAVAPQESAVNSSSQAVQPEDRSIAASIHRVSPLDPMSPFSQPPAPPPSQPLPEKPDTSRSAPSEHPKSALQSLLRAQSERPRSGTASQGSSPIKGENGDIANLVTALRTAQKQIESQSQEVESLKTKLQQESTARQIAEVQAKQLLEQQGAKQNAQEHAVFEISKATNAIDPTNATNSITSNDTTLSDSDPRSLFPETTSPSSTATSPSSNTLINTSSNSLPTVTEVDASTSALQKRLEALHREMDDMKQQMERYRQRAESAEGERSSLLQMVERLRMKSDRGENRAEKVKKGRRGEDEDHEDSELERSRTIQANTSKVIDTAQDSSGTNMQHEENVTNAHAMSNGRALQYKDQMLNDRRSNEDTKSDLTLKPSRDGDEATAQEIRDAMATIMRNPEKFRSQRDMIGQAGPFASMLGVVLIGVGLMTWLNGWQKGDR